MMREHIDRSMFVLDLDDDDARRLIDLLREAGKPLDAWHHELLDRVADQIAEALAEDAIGDA